MHGLVRLAAVGRSLGVHLVLATQRPGGIVSADIRANVSLRIALRVRDRTDSVDVLDDPDAASIDAGTPGRATLRGAATPLTRFQSARVTAAAGPVRRLTVTPLDRGWSDRPEGAAADHGPVAALTDPTDAIAPTTRPRRTDAAWDRTGPPRPRPHRRRGPRGDHHPGHPRDRRRHGCHPFRTGSTSGHSSRP